ncbi:MAG: prepilin-type N-terminal cleavage/methylation domain-containing protein [Vogesella sp.]|uniref:prepilin-type N-terminal cleavage/methylation domain-containing protein n=1 Tax=Vogesella sp. TaxID=1904252 RepID=UPI00391C8E73
MPAVCVRERRAQRGMSLLEALITLLLMSVIGIGTAYVAAKAMVAQQRTAGQHLVVSQIREALAQGACRGTAAVTTTLALGASGVQASCRSVATTLQVVPLGGSLASQGVSVAMPAMQASGTVLGGEVRVDPLGS